MKISLIHKALELKLVKTPLIKKQFANFISKKDAFSDTNAAIYTQVIQIKISFHLGIQMSFQMVFQDYPKTRPVLTPELKTLTL